MKITEAIKERKSVRTFTGEAISDEVRNQLLSFARSVEKPEPDVSNHNDLYLL